MQNTYLTSHQTMDLGISNIHSELLENRTIMLTGEINDYVASSVITQLLLLDAQDSQSEISLYINSPGGSATAGFAIYDTIRHINSEVHTLCVGQACSIAALILAAGDVRYMLPTARVMIHQPSGGIEGKQTDIIVTANEITRVRFLLVERLAYHCNRAIEAVSDDIEKDYFMNPSEARQYGIIDQVLLPPQGKTNKERV